eukprot:2786339-Prorocentrum_lima.AAC.1
MTSSLVGSEMCIRDRPGSGGRPSARTQISAITGAWSLTPPGSPTCPAPCLLYTSDAADDM